MAGRAGLLAFVILALAACQTGTTARSVGGTVLGTRAWHVIPVADSKISVEGDQNLIQERRANLLPSRYQEQWRLKDGGYIFYEELYQGAFSDAVPLEKSLVDVVGRARAQLGLPIKPENIKRTTFKTGSMVYETEGDGERTCFSFFASGFGTVPHAYGEKALRGEACQFKNGALGADVEAKMLDLLKRVKFDDGELNRTPGSKG